MRCGGNPPRTETRKYLQPAAGLQTFATRHQQNYLELAHHNTTSHSVPYNVAPIPRFQFNLGGRRLSGTCVRAEAGTLHDSYQAEVWLGSMMPQAGVYWNPC